MPDSTLSEAIKEAYASAPADQVILHTLALYHSDWKNAAGQAEALYFVQDYAELSAKIEKNTRFDSERMVVFSAMAFELTLPEVKQSTMPEITVILDQVSGSLIPYLDQAVVSTEKITLVYRPYLSTDLMQPQMQPPLELVLSAISLDKHRLHAQARMTDMGGRAFPNAEYNFKNFPALANF